MPDSFVGSGVSEKGAAGEGRGGATWLATVAQICTKTTTSTGASSFQFPAIAQNLFI